MRHCSLFLLLSLLHQVSPAQTCIIARIEKKKITVISDTKMTLRSFGTQRLQIFNFNREPEIRIDTPMTKIGGGNKVFFAVAGLDVIESFKIAKEFCNKYTSIDTIIAKFVENRKAKLLEMAKVIKQIDRNQFDNSFIYTEPMQFLFFGFVKKKPKLFEIRLEVSQSLLHFNTDSSNNNRLRLGIWPIQEREVEVSKKQYLFPDNNPEFPATGIGYTKDIDDSLYKEKTWIGKAEVIGERLLRKQIKGRPEIVGPPIDILVLKKGRKPKWIRVD